MPINCRELCAHALCLPVALATKRTPRQIRNSEKLLKEFQAKIQGQGIEIVWPKIGAK